MVDAVPQKRVLPPRERRESAAKRRDSSPVLSITATPKSAPITKPPPSKSTPETKPKRKYVRKSTIATPAASSEPSTPGTEEVTVLPTKVVDIDPLPTLRTKQPEHLSRQEYQSIAESAVLVASLHRSRVRWLCDGLFEKYWTKPTKKKGDVPANNPDQKSMSKLGACTVTIEPHVFDAVFYTVKDLQAVPIPNQKHSNQHGNKATPPPPIGHYPAPGWGPPPPPPLQQYGPPSAIGSNSKLPPSPGTIKQEVPDRTIDPNNRPTSLPGRPPKENPKSKAVPSPKLRGGGSGLFPPLQAPAESPKPNADPVIQMLASRAATDPHLKELMKEVATSKATPAQLKEFQTHIDEFNAVIKRQEQEAKQSKPTSRDPNSGTAPHKSPTPSASHPSMYSTVPPAPQIRGGSGDPMPPPMYSTPPPHYAPNYPPPPIPRPEPKVKHIVLEFTTPATPSQPASQDRWLFPTYAVLDTPQAGRGLEMIVSFFAERTGEEIMKSQGLDPEEAGNKWKKDANYFQPVTMRLNSMQHKVLMTIAINAKSLPEVKTYMEKVMAEKTRAKDEYLVLNLPKAGVDKPVDLAGEDAEGFQDSGVEVEDDDGGQVEEDDELKDFYGLE